jgi:hypothetical protein
LDLIPGKILKEETILPDSNRTQPQLLQLNKAHASISVRFKSNSKRQRKTDKDKLTKTKTNFKTVGNYFPQKKNKANTAPESPPSVEIRKHPGIKI